MDSGYFTFSSDVENLLFKGVSASSLGGMVALCIGIAAFTFLYEGVKSLRHYIVILYAKAKNSSMPEDEAASHLQNHSCFKSPLHKAQERLKFQCLQTVLHMLQLTMGYMIMLIIMSYNAWFLITIAFVTAVCFYFHEFVLSRKPLTLPVEVPDTNL